MVRKRNRRSDMRLARAIMPLLVITVCIVFSFLFTVLTSSMGVLQTDIKIIFITLLVASTTVASVVALIFFTMFNED